MSSSDSFTPAVGDAAVQAATGRTWPEWFALLDSAGARDMTHQAIVAFLDQEHGVGAWWQQGVTNTYEQRIGRRAKHEMPDGFQVSVSKTVAVPVERLFAAWSDAEARARWLPAPGLTVTKSTPVKSIRARWVEDGTPVSVTFTAKGADKSLAAVVHSKLPDAGTNERMKTLWGAALEQLKALLTALPGERGEG